MEAIRNDKRWARRLSALALIALMGYGGFLRFHDLGVSLYDDEINTREAALQSPAHTLQTRSYPLYYLAANLTLRLGDTEAALRLPSFIAGLLSILAIYGLVRQLHSRTAGLAAAALLAFNPFHITHSDFARYYALVMLFAILTIWCLYLLLERGRWHHWLAYTASAFLGVSAHLCFAPALAALNAGAAVYLLFQGGPWKRRAGRAALLTGCTALACGFLLYSDVNGARFLPSAALPDGAMAGAAPAAGAPDGGEVAGAPWAGSLIAEAHRQRSGGGGVAFTSPDTGETRYLLTYYDFLEYLKRYFWTDTTWVWPALIVLGTVGLLDIMYRVPAAGLPLFFGFFCTPLPLFVLTTKHWYHPRYFSPIFIVALVAVAIGICVLPRFLSRVLAAPRGIRLWRRAPEGRPARAISPANALYVLFVAALAIPAVPAINEAYQTYPVTGYLPRGPLEVNRTPERDWQNLYRFISRTARRGDQFLFMSPADQHGARYARYYLSRFLPWNEGEINFGHRFGVPTDGSMRRFAESHPMANFWCVGYIKYDFGRHAPLLGAAGARQVGFYGRNRNNGLTLFFLGAPTTNHIANGSFETRIREELPPGVRVDKEISFGGGTSLRIDYPESDVGDKQRWYRYAALPVAPAAYRLRNNGFEAWSDGRPVGWNMGNTTRAQADFLRPGFNEGTSLRLMPSDRPAILQQSIAVGLAPGRTLEVQMMGLSRTPDNLYLSLRYQGPGYQEEVQAVHPGTGRWVLMSLEAPIPADANPDSITLEVRRMPGGDGEVLADDVELRVVGLGGHLEPFEPHVLSFAVRTEELRKGGSDRQPGGRARLRWRDATGKKGYLNLMEIRQNSAWHHLSAAFTPGVDTPVDMRSLHVEVGIVDGTGTIWIDEVQLERGAGATPFAETFRLPHDEALAAIDLKPFEAEAPW